MIRLLAFVLLASGIAPVASAQDVASFSFGAPRASASPGSDVEESAPPQQAAAPHSGREARTAGVATPGAVVRFAVGGEIGELMLPGSSPDPVLLYGRVGLFVGHDLALAPSIALSLGYEGSVSINHLEVVQRHGVALSCHLASVLLTVGGGAAIAHAYQGAVVAGGHVLVEAGFQFGNFTMTFPWETDLYPTTVGVVPGMMIGLMLGGSTD